LFALIVMGWATLREVMDVMLTRGEFYGSLQNPNNTCIV
jgi:hypothetical protein